MEERRALSALSGWGPRSDPRSRKWVGGGAVEARREGVGQGAGTRGPRQGWATEQGCYIEREGDVGSFPWGMETCESASEVRGPGARGWGSDSPTRWTLVEVPGPLRSACQQ